MSLQRILAAILGVAAALQGVEFAGESLQRCRGFRERRARFDSSRDSDRSQTEAEVARTFPVMMEKTPGDAAVTIFTALLYTPPFQLHKGSRTVYFQQVVSDEVFGKLRAVKDGPMPNADVEMIERRLRFLERAGFRFSQERLEAALRRSAFLIDFFGDGPEDPLTTMAGMFEFDPVLVWQNEQHHSIGLYRVRARR